MEVDKLRAWFEDTLQSELRRIITELDEAATSLTCSDPIGLLSTWNQMHLYFQSTVIDLRRKFDESADQCIGDVTPDIRDALLATTHVDINRAIGISEDQLSTKYKLIFSSWLLAARQYAERLIVKSMDTLSQEELIYTEASLRESCDETLLNARYEKIS